MLQYPTSRGVTSDSSCTGSIDGEECRRTEEALPHGEGLGGHRSQGQYHHRGQRRDSGRLSLRSDRGTDHDREGLRGRAEKAERTEEIVTSGSCKIARTSVTTLTRNQFTN